MKFLCLKNYKISLLLFYLYFIARDCYVDSFSLLNKNNNFEEIKQDFISKVENNKILTYVKKGKIKVI